MSSFIFSPDNPIQQSFYNGENSTVEDEETKLRSEDSPGGRQAPLPGAVCLSFKCHEGEDAALPPVPSQRRKCLASYQLPFDQFIRETKLMLVKCGRQLCYPLKRLAHQNLLSTK